jgi:hypothetical protein
MILTALLFSIHNDCRGTYWLSSFRSHKKRKHKKQNHDKEDAPVRDEDAAKHGI